jgi:hypothetical protein
MLEINRKEMFEDRFRQGELILMTLIASLRNLIKIFFI